ncbi:MAG: NAD(P)H-dependent oxidoreductase subunit E, partial [Clostridium sp.]
MLLNRKDLIDIRADYKNSLDNQKIKILVCSGTGCIAGGALDIYDKFTKIMGQSNINCEVRLEKEPHDESVGIKKSGCHGFCEMGPLVRIEPWGYLYIKVKAEDCEEIIEKTILNGQCVERLAYTKNGEVYKSQEEIPFYKKQTRLALEHCGHIDSTSIEEYFATGGYSALEKVLFDMNADDVIREVEESNLRGRGGGGFPTGRKWGQVKRQSATEKYIVCNGDEGDPGAFMDRSIMEGDPH